MERKADRTTNLEFAALTAGPALLLVAQGSHPYLAGRLPNTGAVADEVVGGTTRWAIVHLGSAVASALIIVSFLALRRWLHRAGEDRLSTLGVPFVVVGSVLYAVLPGMEFAPLAAAERGAPTAEVAATQDAISGWFMVVLATGGVIFAIGAFAFARAVSVTAVGSQGLARTAAVALVVMALARLLPLSAAQFYLQGAAAVVAFWPLAYAVRRQALPVPAVRPAFTD